MDNKTALTGIELISCAKASAASGPSIAAQNCGYGESIDQFRAALQTACADAGMDIEGVTDLLTDQHQALQEGGVEIAPDTVSQL